MAEIDERIKLAWVDLESTGLNANEEVPLELGIKLTDVAGFVFHEESWLIYEETGTYRERIALAKKHPIVGPMHEASGLWSDLAAASANPTYRFTRSQADDDIFSWLRDCGVEPGRVPMAGNSIGSLDRPFALVHFPRMNEFLSYRNFDISTFKEACKMVNPELFENLRPIIGDKTMAEHRVLSDLDAAIVEWRAYMENFLFVSEDF